VSNDEPERPEFDNLDLPEEDILQPGEEMFEPAEASGEDAAEDAATEPPEAPLAAAGPDEGIEEAEKEKEDAEKLEAEEREEEETEEEEKEAKDGILAKLRQANPYTVMLAVSFVAILISILCLFLELKSYNGDIGAEEAKQRMGMMPAVQSGPPSTTAAA